MRIATSGTCRAGHDLAGVNSVLSQLAWSIREIIKRISGSLAIRNRFRVRIADVRMFRIPASRHQPVHPSETSPFQSLYSPSGLHLAASRAGKQAMRQYHRDFRTVAGSAVHIVGCWEYQEWAFSSRPGNRAREKVTVPASRVWRDAARRGQKPT